MQTLTTSSTNHSVPLTITHSDLSLESEQSSEDINPGTLMILADIEAKRDYYESCQQPRIEFEGFRRKP
jgi:hypothetical protein